MAISVLIPSLYSIWKFFGWAVIAVQNTISVPAMSSVQINLNPKIGTE